MALLQGSIVFLIRSPTICSNFALDSFKFMCLGPEASMVRYGSLGPQAHELEAVQGEV